MNMNESNYTKVARSYYKLLTSIDWNDEILLFGLKEGLNKFLSNAFLKLNNGTKYLQGDYYSKNALEKVQNNDFTNLVYEHMVPKNKYIQKVCEEHAKNDTLTLEFIVELLNKYWKIAVITKEEDKMLSSRSMPKDWDGENIFFRYQKANIQLIMNPMLDNEILWEKLINLIEKNHDRVIENTNGTLGKFESIGGAVSIKTNTKEYRYDNDQDIRDMLFDGWIIGEK
jgi:hypothetical protein